MSLPVPVVIAGSGSGSSCLLDVDMLTQILLIAGGLNWGSIALTGCTPTGGLCSDEFSGDLVSRLSQGIASALNQTEEVGCTIDRVVKTLVGVSAVYQTLQLLCGVTVNGQPLAPCPPNACLLVQQ